ncbi:hypothetical protein V7148_18675 [Gottfriedia acidiceleris]|uniref:hypothetical protein n=1 Tax=Bacillaceae TaxID=186817 RepID=UPI000BEBD478|nr:MULTISPECIES: hypothetical protein [unclassified Bacillus (in: firmicutes)]PEC48704.1 hypothetical protein CON00_14065 [Bacillus sp. AFS096315]PFM82723.1 hypothetical protein COJ46_02635 [Bacillus sp. AFS077874]
MKEIWIEAEQWANEYDIYDANTDVKVIFEDGTEGDATFITYKNILSLGEKNQANCECLGGKYFWVSDMLLIEDISRETITNFVVHLLI